MSTSTWYSTVGSPAQARLVAAWEDAPVENLETLAMLLEVAQEQVVAYAPAPVVATDTTTAPLTRYVYAQLQQAMNLWNAGRVSGDGDLGVDSFTFTPRPLDKTIRTIIRPINAKPNVY